MKPNDPATGFIGNGSVMRNGLTKREWLIGMIAGGYASDPEAMLSRHDAINVIDFADEIIKQMNEDENANSRD